MRRDTSRRPRGPSKPCSGPATIVVESGGEWINPETGEVENKVHLHWRLKKPAFGIDELAQLYEARSLAAQLVGADPTAKSIVHPMRWPGSWHRKKTPRLARIETLEEDAEIDLGEALEKLREAAGAAGLAPVKAPGGVAGDRREAAYPSMIGHALSAIPNGTDPAGARLGLLEQDRHDDLGLGRWLGGRAAGVP